VKKNEALDPSDVGLLCANGIVFQTDFVPHLIKEPGRVSLHFWIDFYLAWLYYI
jgi:hypothetical protein